MEKNEPNQNKYDAALAKYNTQLDDTEVAYKQFGPLYWGLPNLDRHLYHPRI